MNIFFINPQSGLRNFSYEIPLNISQLIACIKDLPFIRSINVLDFELNGYSEDLIANTSVSDDNIVCIPIYTYNWEETIKLCNKVKSHDRNTRVIVGGPHATIDGKNLLKLFGEIDFIMQGECDIAFPELLKSIHMNQRPSPNISGLIYRNDNGHIEENSKAGRIQNLDCIPKQTNGFEYFDLKKIKRNIGFLPYIASRGCTFNCIFCSSSNLWQRKLYLMSPKTVKAELEKIVSLGFRYVNFRDDFFTINHKWLLEVLDYLKELKITWGCETRIDFVDESILYKMKESGCELLRFGIETFNTKSLELLGKKLKADIAEENLKKVFEVGFKEVRSSFLVGIPGESVEDVMHTVHVCRKFEAMKCRFWALTPVIGTELYNKMEKYGIRFGRNEYNATHSNIETNLMSNVELNNLLTDIYDEFKHPLTYYHRDFSDIFTPENPYFE